jgi:hypothetical protein
LKLLQRFSVGQQREASVIKEKEKTCHKNQLEKDCDTKSIFRGGGIRHFVLPKSLGPKVLHSFAVIVCGTLEIN